VLHYIWEPIGVSIHPAARDEYFSYLPSVFGMLKATTDGEDIKNYMKEIEMGHMGLAARPGMEDRLSQVIDILLEYRSIHINL
jgi:hypothetical protein